MIRTTTLVAVFATALAAASAADAQTTGWRGLSARTTLADLQRTFGPGRVETKAPVEPGSPFPARGRPVTHYHVETTDGGRPVTVFAVVRDGTLRNISVSPLFPNATFGGRLMSGLRGPAREVHAEGRRWVTAYAAQISGRPTVDNRALGAEEATRRDEGWTVFWDAANEDRIAAVSAYFIPCFDTPDCVQATLNFSMKYAD